MDTNPKDTDGSEVCVHCGRDLPRPSFVNDSSFWREIVAHCVGSGDIRLKPGETVDSVAEKTRWVKPAPVQFIK